MLVGSIAHQCLSALNHIVWELAARKLGQTRAAKEKWDIAFPIAQSRAAFTKHKVLPLISKPARAAIEQLQPYHREPMSHGRIQHPLFLIQEMANLDKHRVLVASYGGVQLRPLFSGEALAWDEVAREPTFERILPAQRKEQMLTTGTPLVRIRFAEGNEHANVRMEPEPSAQIVFSTDTWANVSLGTIGSMVVTTDRCISEMAHLFPKQSWPPESHDPTGTYDW